VAFAPKPLHGDSTRRRPERYRDGLSGAATLEFGAGVSSAATVADQDIGFSTGGGTLNLLKPPSFYGEISDFATSDTVALLGSWALPSISHVGGVTTLTRSNGSTTHAFEFVGDYAQSDFKTTSGATSTITRTWHNRQAYGRANIGQTGI